ncbi:MAG TPA: hypothetical protein VEH81_03960, partial [Ktedonobacteraceae bacterium]|nr:hypothetical protein [Ktedonobacteraceae bacterium]
MSLPDANNGKPKESSQDKITPHDQKASRQRDVELERLLEEGVSLTHETVLPPLISYAHTKTDLDTAVQSGGDLQGALGL